MQSQLDPIGVRPQSCRGPLGCGRVIAIRPRGQLHLFIKADIIPLVAPEACSKPPIIAPAKNGNTPTTPPCPKSRSRDRQKRAVKAITSQTRLASWIYAARHGEGAPRHWRLGGSIHRAWGGSHSFLPDRGWHADRGSRARRAGSHLPPAPARHPTCWCTSINIASGRGKTLMPLGPQRSVPIRSREAARVQHRQGTPPNQSVRKAIWPGRTG